MVFELGDQIIFPPVIYAEEDGLLAVGGDLNVDRLILAYSSGIFPWFNPEDPIMWWSPNPRPIFIPGAIKTSKSLRATIRKKPYEIFIDRDFQGVLEACANTERKGQPSGTWLIDEMQAAYLRLHELGYAHSVEAWKDNQLVGGLYGVNLGKAFFGESMFYRERDASKIAFYHLSEFLKKHDFHFIDGQVTNDHLLSLGAQEISRNEYLKRLEAALKYPTDANIWKQTI